MFHITKGFKRSKSLQVILAVLFVLLATLVMKYNYGWYDTDIATIISSKTEEISGGDEKEYSQTLTLKIRNHEHKGETCTAQHSYAYSQLLDTAYSVGNDVFVSVKETQDGITAKVIKCKLDYYGVFLITAFIVILILVSGKRGILTLVSLLLNITIFILSIHYFIDNKNIELVTFVVSLFFIIFTLLVLSGFRVKTFGAIASSIVTVILLVIIYAIVYRTGSKPYFELMEYTKGSEEYEALYFTSVIFGSLGAVMDVCITIHASAHEIINTAKELTIHTFIKSLREIGYDIMGTMVNVLFFSFFSGSIPMVLIKMYNGYTLSSIINYEIMFEYLRFLVGSIGIVLAIPVSIAAAIILYHRILSHHEEVKS